MANAESKTLTLNILLGEEPPPTADNMRTRVSAHQVAQEFAQRFHVKTNIQPASGFERGKLILSAGVGGELPHRDDLRSTIEEMNQKVSWLKARIWP